MAFINEIQSKQLGYPGAPGYTTLYFRSSVAGPWGPEFEAVNQFWADVQGVFPVTWSVETPAGGKVLEETTGVLGQYSVSATGAVQLTLGNASGGFGAGVAGAVITWGTGTINRGRLVRGRTFLVPLAAGQYDADGTLTAACMGKLTLAAQNLIAGAAEFGVWSRPRLGVGGLFAPVLTHRVNDRAAFLSSRRA